jgi:hypothetical protein
MAKRPPARKMNPRTKKIGPQRVKSTLVVAAQTLIATVTEAVRIAASRTLYGSNLSHLAATIKLTHVVKMNNKPKLTGTFLSNPQQSNAQKEQKYIVKQNIKTNGFSNHGAIASEPIYIVKPTKQAVKVI